MQVAHLILTATQRLSDALTEQKQDPLSGLTIMPLSQWIRDLYTACMSLNPELGAPLSALQSQWGFHRTVQSECKDILNLSDTAYSAMQAYETLMSWGMPISALEHEIDDSVQTFYRIAHRYQAWLNRMNRIDQNQIVHQLLKYLPTSDIVYPEQISYAGFDKINPMTLKLFDLIQASGVQLEAYQFNTDSTADILVHPCRSKEDEYRQAALAVQRHIQANPNHTAAVIVPNLTQDRALIEQTFWAVFDPDYRLNIGHKPKRPFNLSGGESFLTQGLIQQAFRIWRQIDTTKQSTSDWLALLRSPYQCQKNDTLEDLAQDTQLILLDPREYLSVAEVNQLLTTKGRVSTPVTRLIELKSKTYKAHTLNEWLPIAWDMLVKLGWPGDRILDSREYQVLMQWQASITECYQLSEFCEAVSFTEFISTIKWMTEQKLFQMKSEKVNIHVLGLLEAGGLAFDFAWVTGLDAISWPISAQPNPFIPLGMQRHLSMPHASAERELDFAKSVMHNFQMHCQKLRYSYPSLADAFVNHPSPLLLNYPTESISSEPKQITTAHPFTMMQDDCVKPYEPNHLRGGSGLLQSMSICPFQAQARYRLGLKEVERPKPGLSSAERGELIHYVLASFWQDVKTRRTLLGMTQADIDHILLNAMETFYQTKLITKQLPTGFWLNEKKRHHGIINKWLSYEKERPEFTVQSVEKVANATLCDKRINCRIDRLDRLEDGTLLVIDYKTAKIRPQLDTDKQLPLYALAEPGVEGVMIAHLTLEHAKSIGIAAHDIDMDGISTLSIPWDEYKAEQKEELSALIGAYISGASVARPRHETDCTYCQYTQMCRYKEVAL